MSTLAVDAITNVTGTSALTIDGSGRMGVSNPIYCWVRKSNQSLSAAGTIVWDIEMVDTANAYNNTNGLFTCPRAGYYEVNWHYLHRFNGYLRTTVQKNNAHVWGSGSATILYSNNTDAGDEIQVAGMALVNCAAGDTLSIYLVNTSGSADLYGGSNSHNGFMIKFLG